MTTIDPAWLHIVTGGANKANKALETQITQLKSTVEDVAREQNNSGSSLQKLLPMMVIAKMRR